MNLVKNGDTYDLQGLSARQLGLLMWAIDTAIIAAERTSSLAADARDIQHALDVAGPAEAFDISKRIDKASSWPILDEVVRYAPEDE